MGFHCAQGLDVDRPLVAHTREVVADQVDDHDVLRDVLGQQSVRRSRRPLDRRGDQPLPDRVRNCSGDAETTSSPAAPTWMRPAYGAGLPCAGARRVRRGPRRRRGRARGLGRGWPGRRCPRRPRRRPPGRRPRRVRCARHRPARSSGPTVRWAPHWTSAKRTAVKAPSNVITTAQKPCVSSASRAWGPPTSRTVVATRSPNRATSTHR